MHSSEAYVLVAKAVEELVTVSPLSKNVYRTSWILCQVKMYQRRTGHFCLHCPSCAGLAEETETISGGQINWRRMLKHTIFTLKRFMMETRQLGLDRHTDTDRHRLLNAK